MVRNQHWRWSNMKHLPTQSACVFVSIPTPDNYAVPAPKHSSCLLYSTMYVYIYSQSFLQIHISANQKNIRSYVAPDHRIQQPVSRCYNCWAKFVKPHKNIIYIYIYTESSAKGEPKHGTKSSREFSQRLHSQGLKSIKAPATPNDTFPSVKMRCWHWHILTQLSSTLKTLLIHDPVEIQKKLTSKGTHDEKPDWRKSKCCATAQEGRLVPPEGLKLLAVSASQENL